jgi:hypothetical protein
VIHFVVDIRRRFRKRGVRGAGEPVGNRPYKTVLSMRKRGPEVQEEMWWVEYVSFSPLDSFKYYEIDDSRFLRNDGRTVLSKFTSQPQNRIVTEEC